MHENTFYLVKISNTKRIYLLRSQTILNSTFRRSLIKPVHVLNWNMRKFYCFEDVMCTLMALAQRGMTNPMPPWRDNSFHLFARSFKHKGRSRVWRTVTSCASPCPRRGRCCRIDSLTVCVTDDPVSPLCRCWLLLTRGWLFADGTAE